jgi:hypothetical protein
MSSLSRWRIGWEQKSRYQRNLLYSNLIVITICVLIGALLYLTGNPSDGGAVWGRYQFDNEVSNADAPESYAGSFSEHPYAFGGRASRELPDWSGYAGRIQPAVYEVNVVAPGEVRPTGEVPGGADLQTLSVLPTVESPGYGGGAGDDRGAGDGPFGLPPTEPYLPPPRQNPAKTDMYGGILEYRQAVASLRSPRFPGRALAWRIDSGVVEVKVTIQTDGTIAWDILREEPKGWGFAVSVEQALLRSEYRPEIRGGQPYPVDIYLRVLMCRKCPSRLDIERGRVAAYLDDRGG